MLYNANYECKDVVPFIGAQATSRVDPRGAVQAVWCKPLDNRGAGERLSYGQGGDHAEASACSEGKAHRANRRGLTSYTVRYHYEAISADVSARTRYMLGRLDFAAQKVVRLILF